MTHLHDEAKDVRIVIKHNAATHVRVKLACSVGHDAGRKVSLDFAEELIVNDDFLRGKFHRSGVITFHASKHNSVSDKS